MATLNFNKDTLIKLSIKNSFFSSLGSIATLLVSMFAAGYSIRILGEALAGFLMLMQTIIGVSSSLTDFGFGTSVVKAISEAHAVDDSKKIEDTIKATSFFNILIAIFLGIIIAAFAFYIVVWAKVGSHYMAGAQLSIYFFVLSFLINTSISSYRALPSALQRFEFASLISGFQAITSGGIQILILIYYPSILNLAIGSLIASIIQLFLIIWVTYKLLGKFIVPMSNWKVIKELFGYSTIVFITGLVYQARNYSDRWILTSLEGAVVLPGYVLGQTLMQKVLSFVASPFYFLFPMLSSSSVQMDKKKVFKIYSNFHWFVSIIGTFIFISIALNSFWILEVWIKQDFAIKYNYLFQFACLQGVFASFSVVPHFSSFGLGKPSNNLWEASLTASIVLILSLIMVPIIGVLGAAIAQLLAYILMAIFIQVQIKKTIFKEFNLIELFRPILPSVIIGCSSFLFLFYLSFKNVFINLSFIDIVILNLLIGFIIIMVVMAEKYLNKNSGRYQIFIDALSIIKKKAFA